MTTLETDLQRLLSLHPAGIDHRDGLWDAAVLVPLVYEEGEPCILFEVRASTLRRQPGEICFPGGKYECKDKSFAKTAIRETCEELGLTEDGIELLGELDVLVTHGGPIIHPFVGVIKNMDQLSYNPSEVHSVFTVPLKLLLECTPRIGHVQLADRPCDDFPFDLVPTKLKNWRFHKSYKVYFYEYQDKVIWGLTARMLYTFLEKCRKL